MGDVLTASLREHAGALPYLLMNVGEVALAYGLWDVRLRRQAEVHRDRVGIVDAGYEAGGESSAGKRECADSRPWTGRAYSP